MKMDMRKSRPPPALDTVKLLEQDPEDAVVHWIDKSHDWFQTICGINFSRRGYRHKRYQAAAKPLTTCVACIATVSRGN